MAKIADFSHYQGSVNWADASKELALAIIRVQYGSTTIDKKYKEHVAGCKKYGVSFGHYAYGLYVSVNDAKKEAQDFLSRIDKDAKFLVLDIEGDTLKACGPDNLLAASQAFIDTCRDAGYKTGAYIQHNMYDDYGLEKLQADFLWLPRYATNDNGLPNNPKPDYPCHLWQYTQRGKLAGVAGNVDLNQLNGDKDLEWFIGKQPNAIDPVFISSNTIIQRVRALVKSDIRKAPSHDAEFVRDTVPGEEFNVFAREGDWHNVGGANWIDGANGNNLWWIRDTKPQPATPKAIYHVVQAGDTVSSIASKYSTTIAMIKSWNNLTDINKIYVGQKLRVK